jgi:hypothetical protein
MSTDPPEMGEVPLASLHAARPAPLPVIPIQPEYDSPFDDQGRRRRAPGIITAVGILSIILGLVGMGGGAVSAFIGFGVFVGSRQAANFGSGPIVIPRPQQVSYAYDMRDSAALTPHGLGATSRRQVIAVLVENQPMPLTRQLQLHALLAKSGQDIFPGAVMQIDRENIRQSIAEHGKLPSASDATIGADFFDLATGRIEIYDDHALFSPADHGETVRASTGMPDNSTAATPAAVPAADVQSAMQMIDQQTNHAMTPVQRQAVLAELALPGGVLGPSAGRTTVQLHASLLPGGSLHFTTGMGQMEVASAGTVESRIIYQPMAYSPPNLFTRQGAWAFSKPGTGLYLEIGTVFLEGIASLLLGIYLLVSAIFTIRQARIGRKLHLIYAWIKIPLAITCGVAWCAAVSTGMPRVAGGSPPKEMFVWAIVLMLVTVLPVLYPIALLIVFATPTAKRYYQSSDPAQR